MTPDQRLQAMLGIALPIIQAPMAGAGLADLAIAVAGAGGLGSLPCALLEPDRIRAQVARFRQHSDRPLNLNFFCHQPPAPDRAGEVAWLQALAPFYREFGLDPSMPVPKTGRAPFGAELCALVEALRPEVVSFHFGLPDGALMARVAATGARILSTATTVAEARWLEKHGVDAIIAQGVEAGGHRGMFLGDEIATQIGTLALVPQVVDAVRVPVIAAGGIADGRSIAAARMLGAAGVQIGTAYLLCPEATTHAAHRRALAGAGAQDTALSNVFTGRPARGIVNRAMRALGPMSAAAPAFPLAGAALVPLRAAAEKQGRADFTPLWAGQSAPLCREMPAGDLTRQLAEEARTRLVHDGRE